MPLRVAKLSERRRGFPETMSFMVQEARGPGNRICLRRIQAAIALRGCQELEIGFGGYLSPVLRSCSQAISGLFGEGMLSGMLVCGLSGGLVRGSSHLWISE